MTTQKSLSVFVGAFIALAIVFVGVQVAFAAHNADGLAGYWSFDDGANPTADTSGHGNNGAVNGGALFSGSALTFDGTDDFVSVAHSSELDMTSAYSVSARVNVTDVPAGTYRPILFRGTTNINDIEVYVQWGSGDLIVAHNRGNGGGFDYVGFDNPPVGTPFHLVVTYGSGIVQAYYDGVPAAVVQQTTAVTAPLDTDRGWWIGKVDHSAFGGPHLFKGTLDEVRLYNRALTTAEVGALGDYSDFAVSSDTPSPAYNPIGTDHTVVVTVAPALAGIPVLFVVTGTNTTSDTEMTNGAGAASFTYTSNGTAGTDTITACVDADDNGSCAEESSVVLTKVWLDKYVTGGGNIKGANGKPLWTFGGNVGIDTDGNPVGQFQIVNHSTKETCHFRDIDSVSFIDDETIRFTADGSCKGTTVSSKPDVDFIIHDDGEPGTSDTIEVEGMITSVTPLSGGNFQVDVPPFLLAGEWLLIANGAYSHDMVIAESASGVLTGTGGYPSTGPPYDYPYNWTLTGLRTGSSVAITITYQNGYTAAITGTIDGTYNSMSGGAGTGGVTDWTATRIP